MPRPLHHLVLPVTTLNLARGRLESLGFTVAPDAAHPFGTGNCCVFFGNGTYLEPLAIMDRNAADKAAAEGQVFVRRARSFLQRRGEGFAMLALRTADAEADQIAFEGAKVSAGPPFRFKRMALLPDGSEFEIGVVLAYAVDAAAPDATFFACQPIAAEKLWDPAYTDHPNRVRGVIGVAAVAENPADFHILLSAATGQRELRATSFALEAEVDGGTIAILTPAGFLARYGAPAPEPRRGLIFAAFDLAVDDPALSLKSAGVSAIRAGDRLIVPPGPGLGAFLSFRSSRSE